MNGDPTTPGGCKAIARFIMTDDAASITRDQLRDYLRDQYPTLTSAEHEQAVTDLHGLIGTASVTINWESERHGQDA